MNASQQQRGAKGAGFHSVGNVPLARFRDDLTCCEEERLAQLEAGKVLRIADGQLM